MSATAFTIILTVIVAGSAALAVLKLLDSPGAGLSTFIVPTFVGLSSAYGVAGATRDPHWQSCTVTGKDRGKDTGSYRIYTRQCDTLGDEDSWINGKHNSSNLYGQIEVGKTYDFKIVGFRSGVFSHFANILAIRETQQQ